MKIVNDAQAGDAQAGDAIRRCMCLLCLCVYVCLLLYIPVFSGAALE